jgi:hypothetical protein
MKFYMILVLCFFAFSAVVNKKAITDEGDVVILNGDGTWIYENGKAESEIKLDMNPLTFSKSSDSKFMLKSRKTNNVFWINPKNGHSKKMRMNMSQQNTHLMLKVAIFMQWLFLNS